MTQAALHVEPTAAASVDPVCGMTVDPARAAGRAEHAGRIYLFCSAHCLGEFQRDPARYAGVTAGSSDSVPATPTPPLGADMHAAGRPLQSVLRRAESGQAKDRCAAWWSTRRRRCAPTVPGAATTSAAPAANAPSSRRKPN
ncbi:YHS domain-containing protein [Methylibium sp. T29-B]|uniref:YHS domain-containing protein n=1 Tax=Methylibium sp. T29-B TaxID=1437443 RepID=UPI0018CC03F6|nr:YHS domain-containing protein [Methylibium sp. T29-B]